MKLYLVRHAAALDGADDDTRPLSDRGRKRFARVVKRLAGLGVEMDHIVHSPKLRAVQTADALTRLLRDEGTAEVLDALAETPGPDLFARLAALDGDTALVGHEPHLTHLLAKLVADEDRPCSELKKGGVAVLEGEPRPGGMMLTLLLTPKAARRLA